VNFLSTLTESSQNDYNKFKISHYVCLDFKEEPDDWLKEYKAKIKNIFKIKKRKNALNNLVTKANSLIGFRKNRKNDENSILKKIRTAFFRYFENLIHIRKIVTKTQEEGNIKFNKNLNEAIMSDVINQALKEKGKTENHKEKSL
jgi:hypothetical protein